jgi:hypothetical protein
VTQPLPPLSRDALHQRLVARSDVDPAGCWLWTRALDRYGYGKVRIHKVTYQVHRLAYQVLVGSIPLGLTLDHTCRSRACWRPDHLEPVPQRINNLRGPTNLAHVDTVKYHCPQGHPYSEENTYIRRRPDGLEERECRTCRRDQQRRVQQRRRAA